MSLDNLISDNSNVFYEDLLLYDSDDRSRFGATEYLIDDWAVGSSLLYNDYDNNMFIANNDLFSYNEDHLLVSDYDIGLFSKISDNNALAINDSDLGTTSLISHKIIILNS